MATKTNPSSSDIQEIIAQTLRTHGMQDESVSRDVLVRAMMGLNPEWNARDLENVLQQIDGGSVGQVKIDTFVQWIFGGTMESLAERFPELKPGVTPTISAIQEGCTIEYFTDVEGNWEYFLYFVHFSKILRWEGPDRGAWGPGSLAMSDNGILVFWR